MKSSWLTWYLCWICRGAFQSSNFRYFLFPWPSSSAWAVKLADKPDSCLPFSGIYCKAGHPRLQASFCSLDLTYTISDLDLDFLGAELSVICSTDQLFVSGGTIWVRNLISISLSKLRGVGTNQYLVTPLSWTHPDQLSFHSFNKSLQSGMKRDELEKVFFN